jgi:DNA-binding MarR family transcriptional regulator
MAAEQRGSGPLSEREWAVWRGFVDWNQRVRDAVAGDVTRASGMSFPDFEVLVRLDSAGGEAGQRELLESLGWSASRLSHQLRRMTERDQVERHEIGPGRLVLVRLRPAGREAIGFALAVLGDAVRGALLDQIDESFADFLARQHHGSPRSLD